MSRAESARAQAAWLGVVAVWSTTPLTIKWSAEALGPWLAIAARTLVGALIFLLLFALPGARLERTPTLWRAARLAAAFSYAGMLLLYAGAPPVPSGILSVVYGMSPLVTALLAALVWRDERLTLPKLLGAALGAVGMAMIFGGGASLGADARRGLALLVTGMTVNCVSLVVLKRAAREVSVRSLTALVAWLTAPLFLLTWWIVDGALPASVAPRALWSVLWLGAMGTVVGFLLFYYALKHLAASRVALITLVTPLSALALGHLLNDERLPPLAWSGSALVLAGVACATLWGSRRAARAPSI